MKNLISVLAYFLVFIGTTNLGLATESHFDASPFDIKPHSGDAEDSEIDATSPTL